MEFEIKYKQFVIVSKRPKMSKGKMASQVAHSTFMALENQRKHELDKKNSADNIWAPANLQEGYIKANLPERKMDLIEAWKKEGMCVIVLQCANSIELLGIDKYLEQWGIPHHLYLDEGITEVNMGTPTALATGILTADQFWMLQTMRLFK